MLAFANQLFAFESSNDSIAKLDSIPIQLSGLIYSRDSSQNSAFVHIINKRTGRGTISDTLGLFKTKMLKPDTLIIRAIGFEDKYFTLADSIVSKAVFVELCLEEKSYDIDVVDIIGLTRFKQFKYEFSHVEFATDKWEDQMIIPGVSRSEYQWIRKNEHSRPKKTINGPISAIYGAFNNKIASQRKYIELISNAEDDQIIDEKFNMKLLAEFTGFTGDTLVDFKLFLDYSRAYLLKHNAYEIFLNVKYRIPHFKEKYFTAIEQADSTNKSITNKETTL